jgi:hypothetical protein
MPGNYVGRYDLTDVFELGFDKNLHLVVVNINAVVLQLNIGGYPRTILASHDGNLIFYQFGIQRSDDGRPSHHDNTYKTDCQSRPIVGISFAVRRYLTHSHMLRFRRFGRLTYKSQKCEREQSSRGGGQRGIRTLGRLSPTHAFQACAIDHSATCPFPRFARGSSQRRMVSPAGGEADRTAQAPRQAPDDRRRRFSDAARPFSRRRRVLSIGLTH